MTTMDILRAARRARPALRGAEGERRNAALLAMAGDLGGAFGPGLVGGISQRTGDNLQKGMLAGCVFPLVLMAALFILRGLRQSQGPKPEGQGKYSRSS